MRDALSDERTGLSFTIAAGPRQHILGSEYSRIYDNNLLSQIRDSHKPGGPISPIYIP
jgi:hypothetical protein